MTFRITKAALLPAVLTALILPPSAADEAAPPRVGDHAEDFELAKVDGKKLKLSARRAPWSWSWSAAIPVTSAPCARGRF
jgi:hypothetical protein